MPIPSDFIAELAKLLLASGQRAGASAMNSYAPISPENLQFNTPTMFEGQGGYWINDPRIIGGVKQYPFVNNAGQGSYKNPMYPQKGTSWLDIDEPSKIEDIQLITSGKSGTSGGSAWDPEYVMFIRSLPKDLSDIVKVRIFESYLKQKGDPMNMYWSP